MDYCIKATTIHHGGQVPILRKVYYDMQAEETLIEQKILGTTVVECHNWPPDPGDHTEAFYNLYLRDGWVVIKQDEFDSHTCNRWREP